MKLAKKMAGILIIALIAVIISYFAKANDRYVTLDLVFYTVENIQIWLLTLFCFCAGIVFSVIYMFFEIIFINLREKKLKKENKKLKEEISKIRNSKLSEIDGEENAIESQENVSESDI